MKKVLYTLALKGYPHELTGLTFPWLKYYAAKIGAEFQVIEDRKFPDWPVTAEKMQIWELGRDNDFSIFVDADAVINPELMDVTAMCPPNSVLFTGKDMSAMRFRSNKWFERDGRFLGCCTWFFVVPYRERDLVRPLDKEFFWAAGQPESDDPKDLIKAVVGEIFPTNAERMCRIGDNSKPITADKLIEDYIFSCNVARFKLNYLTIEPDPVTGMSVKQMFGRQDAFYWHQYTKGIDQKIIEAISIMMAWGMITPEIQEKYNKLIEKIKAMPKPQQFGQMPMMQPPC